MLLEISGCLVTRVYSTEVTRDLMCTRSVDSCWCTWCTESLPCNKSMWSNKYSTSLLLQVYCILSSATRVFASNWYCLHCVVHCLCSCWFGLLYCLIWIYKGLKTVSISCSTQILTLKKVEGLCLRNILQLPLHGSRRNTIWVLPLRREWCDKVHLSV